MITEEEMKRFADIKSRTENNPVYSVTPEEMKKFANNASDLSIMIYEKKIENDQKYGLKATPGYDKIEDLCMISTTSLKKTMNGTDRVTRTFLYKFCVGLQMSVDEANKFFSLCEGELNEENPADYICIKALQDKDAIENFCADYEKYIGKKIKR